MNFVANSYPQNIVNFINYVVNIDKENVSKNIL